MRRNRVRLCAMIGLLGVASATPGAASPQATRYFALEATAAFDFQVDYGDDHPESVINGVYQKNVLVEIRALVRYDGRSLKALPGKLITYGQLHIGDARTTPDDYTIPPDQRGQKPWCRSWGGVRGRTQESRTFRQAGGGLSVSPRGLWVKPGRVIPWKIKGECAEGDLYHGLRPGPSFTVRAPARSRFTAGRPSSLVCHDVFSHEPEPDYLNGHSFDGSTTFRLSFRPFPEERLGAAETELRKLIGKRPRVRPLPQPPKGFEGDGCD